MSDTVMTVDDLTYAFDTISALSNDMIPDVTVVVSPDLDKLAFLLAKIRKAQAELKDAAQWVEDELTKQMPGKEHEVPGLGVIEMHTGAKRTQWDKPGLVTAMTHVIARNVGDLVAAETGEPVNNVRHVETVLDMYHEAATPSWKVTGLRKHGIDPSDYCETSWGRKTIVTPLLPMPDQPTEDQA